MNVHSLRLPRHQRHCELSFLYRQELFQGRRRVVRPALGSQLHQSIPPLDLCHRRIASGLFFQRQVRRARNIPNTATFFKFMDSIAAPLHCILSTNAVERPGSPKEHSSSIEDRGALKDLLIQAVFTHILYAVDRNLLIFAPRRKND